MKYVLKIHALGRYPEIEIDKNKYDSIRRARVVLSHGLAMEEKYEILISNYLEFEKEILDQAAQSMIRNPSDYNDFFQVRLGFNIRLVNLLTTARLYVDQLHRHVRAAIPEVHTVKEDIKDLFSKEFDENSEYRFMEALRNYVQHRGLPVHWTQHSAYSDDTGEVRQLIYSMELRSQKKYLQEDGVFKEEVLEELSEEVDLKMATRVYVECLSKVHCGARSMVEQSLKESRSIIDSARTSYQQIYPEKFVGLHAICLEDNRFVDSTPLLLDWDDIRLKLTKRNSKLVNLRNAHVTGRSKIS